MLKEKVLEYCEPEHKQTLIQFFTDAEDGLNNTNLSQEKADQLKAIVKQYQITAGVKNDDVLIIDTDLTSNGGHITFRKGMLRRDFEGYGEFIDLTGEEKVFLIESPEYRSKHVEPYNRQKPFYIGYGFNILKLTKVNGWNIYNTPSQKTNIMFRLDDFYYNDYWQMISFGAIVEPEKEIKFIEEVLNNLFHNDITKAITDQIK